MTTDNSVASIDRLRKFIPLQDLSDSQLQTLADAVEVERAQQDQLLINIRSQDNYSFLLMEGAIRLKAEDGRVMDLTSEHVSARSPIARVTTSGKAEGLKFMNRSKRLFMAPPKGGNVQSKSNCSIRRSSSS